ncbi:hypothetical protein LCI18_002250 [Fusarium solani-melongenae]|uniref:Uncharacterized protein n=1 Tax=Fusarium solani subsp. cucurbitae TaxID=2747967 RepID=A0ACD3YR03_FUSSC|nr:hypothetical protein LCI18_002250 [Fusarium solani-melongenae]
MTRAPRKYVPKVKGCYECSQRRINCDRGEPECAKCVSKGFACSGIGPRYRFRNGLAAKRKGVPSRNRLARSSDHHGLPSDSEHPDDGRRGQTSVPQLPLPSVPVAEERVDGNHNQLVRCDVVTGPKQSATQHTPLSVLPCLNHIAPLQRLLLKHFSDHIAPEMVVIDDCNNGWRSLVLPLACADELVMSSVMAVSAFHLSERAESHHLVNAGMLYSKAIFNLQKRQDLHQYDIHARYRIIVSIIVLLLGMMVNGSSDFPIMFRMLQSLDLVGGESVLAAGSKVIADFSVSQIHKMRVYASPFISQDEGVSAVATQIRQSWADQQLYFHSYPAHSRALGLISKLRDQAFQIYLNRASSVEGGVTAPADLISTFKQMLESFPEALPGEHVLVWPIFIAASESHDPDHQQFFTRLLEKQFRRNGFMNILKALESLRRIWARGTDENWTALLPEQPVLVM